MILKKLVEAKREHLDISRQTLPLPELEALIASRPRPLGLEAALQGERVSLIAEVKKASPSKGLLCPSFDPVALAQTYADNGAAAISVLTEGPNFGGSLDHLSAIKGRLGGGRPIPLLRKDFVFESYQVYESRGFGADALLLIIAILSDAQLKELLDLSHSLGMECLVEVHDGEEVARALECGASVIGINNRDLNVFAVDLETTMRLRPLIPNDRVVVSESGIKTRDDMRRLEEWGVDAALIGEALVMAPDVAAKVVELL